MKKSLLALFAFVLFTVTGFAQAYEGTAEYDKKKQPAIIIDYAYPSEAVEAAVVQKMERMGYKGKEEKGLFNKDKGFRVYKAAIISDISSNSMDYMIDVERKSRKEKDESSVYLIINKNGQNIMEGSADPDAIAAAKEFLNKMIPEVEAANLELQIKAQEEVITKSEKKLKGLRDDQDDLEKKLKNNQRDQENAQKDIDNQKAALENLRGKRKN
jgi:hypothetical protein